MSQRSSAPARAFAAAALVCGFAVVVAIVATSFGDGDGGRDGSGGRQAAGRAATAGGDTETPKSYVVQNGDTLTSIGHKTGVSVARIQELNPGVDPQILVSGEKLKLR
jgi:spore germination protein YaaH